MTEQLLPTSAITYRLAGREYPVHRVVGCRTCASPHRLLIEKAIVRGASYRSIARSLPHAANITDIKDGDTEEAILDRIVSNLSRHVHNDHMPHEITQWRATLEYRAQEIGIDVREHQGYVGDHIALARLTIQRSLERLSAGEIQPDLKDAAAMAKLLEDFGANQGGPADAELYFQAFMLFWEAIQAEGMEVSNRISARISQNPILDQLRERMKAGAISATSVPVETGL